MYELARECEPNYAPCMGDTVLSKNIATLRGHLRDNQEAFAKRLGVPQSYVSKWENLDIEPKARPMGRIVLLANCTVDQFMDEPWLPGSEGSTGPIPKPANDDDTADIVALDLSLSMGPGTLIEEFVEGEPVKISLRFIQGITRTPTDRLRLVRGIGDSMEPTLRTGDDILVDLNERQLSRTHGVYWIDHLGTHGIKRLRPASRGKVLIMSDNPNVPDFEADAADIRIEGRVIWFAREL